MVDGESNLAGSVGDETEEKFGRFQRGNGGGRGGGRGGGDNAVKVEIAEMQTMEAEDMPKEAAEIMDIDMEGWQ